MNNLKFRVWDKKYNELLYGQENMVSADGALYLNYDIGKIKAFGNGEYVIQQFTGLKDKNQKDIYEGDIISFSGNLTADDSCGLEPNGFFYDENSIHSIIWNEKLAGWDLNFDENDIIKYKRDTRGLLLDGSCEIIGNIFENPELLV